MRRSRRAAFDIAKPRLRQRDLPTGFVPASTLFRSRRTNRNRRNRRGAGLNKTYQQRAARRDHGISGDVVSGDIVSGNVASDDAASADAGGTCGTDGLALRVRGCRSYQNTFAISARNQHSSISLSLASLLTEQTPRELCETSRCPVLRRAAASLPTGAACSASDSISFSKNESESEKSARSDS